jgi:hypothetical protein
MGRRPDEAANLGDIEAAAAETQRSSDPAPEDLLLADARHASSLLAVTAMWKYQRRDTARVVLLSAIASEVRVKRALRENAPREFLDLLDVVLDNPRDVTIAAAQLLDKPMQAAIGISLRGADKQLFRDVTKLFELRNRVAHYAYKPTLTEAQGSLETAVRLSGWLGSLEGPGALNHGASD